MVQINSSHTVAAQIVEGSVDIGLVGAIWNDRGLEWTAAFTDTLVLAVPVLHPLAGAESVKVEELRELPFIQREAGSGTRRVVARMFEQQGIVITSYSIHYTKLYEEKSCPKMRPCQEYQ